MTKFNFNLNRASYIGLVAFAFFLLNSCGYNYQDSFQQSVIQVDFYEVKPISVTTRSSFPGSMEGSVNVDVKSQVTGYLDYIYVDEGNYVRKGQPLFMIKSDIYNEQVNNSKATLESALAAQNNANLEIEKLKPLVAGKVVSEMQLKTAEANYESAKALVAQAKSALNSSQINAEFCLIKAPVSGYIGRIPNRVGNLVTPSDETPLTTLSDIDKMFVYFSLSESDFISFHKDAETKKTDTVELILANGDVYTYKGVLESASGNIDPTTGSIAMKAVFPNPDKLLRSGGSARIVMKRSFHSVLTIPIASAKDIQDKLFVFTLNGSNKVTMRPIEIGGRTDSVYIIKKGLHAGDKIAINCIDLLNEKDSITSRVVSGNY